MRHGEYTGRQVAHKPARHLLALTPPAHGRIFHLLFGRFGFVLRPLIGPKSSSLWRQPRAGANTALSIGHRGGDVVLTYYSRSQDAWAVAETGNGLQGGSVCSLEPTCCLGQRICLVNICLR
ncbi:MAG: hypothetical protein EOQ42_01725 [Mesorhizobium sp.]|nr:MAG: hypothetical protein EOQ43_00300 [Mesorhizobium sp.]RWB82039.1 MAG: hypothetical protein EOQ42_01725 [Mesorhizobium sp.]RWD22268.1 MAG: hypothetical protein EOS57_03545 [Mesorhizobium sp.]TIU80254.1 MAG: hypothetical protein E5W13_04040 [Mesorhizobium sp.]